MSIPGFRTNRAYRVCLWAAPLLFAACASQPEAIDGADEAQSTERAVGLTPVAAAADNGVSQADSLLSQRVIHFDFDNSNVAAEYQALLVAHGQYLSDHGTATLRLEGHADERGTREYNVGLGERRASTVRQLLLLQGASDDQIEVLSYGEESPVATGSNEQDWWQNRRVEFNYLSE